MFRLYALRPLAIAALLCLGPSAAAGQDAFSAPLRELDPLELARLAQRVGDAAVLEVLSDAERPAPARLRAIRAARFLAAPELSLPALATLAAGRDPLLAPAAALSAYRVAAALEASALDAREADRGPLVEARRALIALADDASARADLRRAAAFAAERLEPLLVAPAPPEG